MIIFLCCYVDGHSIVDAFNTLGMPTSTTVSLIFELLGASIMVSAFKIIDNDQPLNWLLNINNPAEGITGYISTGQKQYHYFSILFIRTDCFSQRVSSLCLYLKNVVQLS